MCEVVVGASVDSDTMLRFHTTMDPAACVYIANVPSFLTLAELLAIVSPPAAPPRLRAARVLLPFAPATYALAVLYDDTTAAVELQSTCHMRPLSVLAKEMLAAEFVAEEHWDALFPDAAPPGSPATMSRQASTDRGLSPHRSATAHPHGCSICLEPLGPSLQLPCGHCFDIACFARVEEGACPLCRFNVCEASARCEQCGTSRDLWLCLVCGVVHCGHGGNGHTAEHYRAHSGHALAMQVGGYRVWDFAAGTFVHRVAATLDGTEADGGAWREQVAWSEKEEDVEWAMLQARTDTIADHYSRLLTHQLGIQEDHFRTALEAEQRDGGQSRVAAAEADGRRSLVAEAAAHFSSVARQAREAATAAVRQARRKAAAVRKETSPTEATTEALRRNVEALRAMKRKAEAAPVKSVREDPEVQRLEAELAAEYAKLGSL